MILFLILLVIIAVVLGLTILTVGTVGGLGIVLLAEPIICVALIIGLIMLIKRRKNRE